MGDYISRAAAIKVAESYEAKSPRYCLNDYEFGRTEVADKIADDLEDLPAADVIPVRHGEWIFNGYEWKCSECRCVVEDEKPTQNFCPNCGTKMNREE